METGNSSHKADRRNRGAAAEADQRNRGAAAEADAIGEQQLKLTQSGGSSSAESCPAPDYSRR